MRAAATLDKEGLVCSQQFFGLWPHEAVSDVELLTFAAILNGPVANAFLAIHSPANRMRISAVEQIPVPSALPIRAGDLTTEYLRLLTQPQALRQDDEKLESLLTQIDAAALSAYDLPPRLERQLLDYFRHADRPVAHPWRHWDASNATAGLTLAERVSGRFHPHGSWVREVFHPLPDDEARLLRTYGD